MKDQHKIVAKEFSRIGFSILRIAELNETGVDLWVQGKSHKAKPLAVEVKVARATQRGGLQCPQVSIASAKACDLIAIIIGKYVFIDSMNNHLASISAKGFRNLTHLIDAVRWKHAIPKEQK